MIIRWICKKCGKKWIYPIEKCVYCKSPIEKQKGTKLKIIGITKVSIPSPMHPIIPYNIILLQDEFGNKLPKKTMKEYKIGDDYDEQKARTEDAVSVVKIKYDIYEAIKEALRLLDFSFNPDDKILVKPSVTYAAYPYQAINTNPEFLKALFKILLESGIKKENIMVAEQALIGSDAVDAASKAGILEACKTNGIEFVDISKQHFQKIESDGFAFNVLKEALNRKVINVPVMKTNFQIGISGALENLSRLADQETQREMYFSDIEKMLPKLVKLLPEVFNIADATNGMQGQGPLSLGEPAFFNMILAGRNAANLDSAFCQSTMLQIPGYVSSLANENIEFVGNELDALKYPIKAANPNETPHPDIKVIDGKACPSCLNIMYEVTSKLIGLRGEQINVAIGPMLTESMLKGKERLIALGECAAKRLEELGIQPDAKIDENTDRTEQIILMQKLLTTKGVPKITPVDKVKSKMRKLLSKVM